MVKLFNTLSRKKEEFKPLKDKKAGIYTCGPTVYWFAHIGNLRTYLFEDLLKRVLDYSGYKVNHVMNITDVGHLTSDADTGEDKLEKGAKREKKTVWEIAEFYTDAFKKDLKLLNIKEPDIWIKATDTIKDQIDLIKVLEKKGFAYKIEDGVYFDTSKLKTYGRLWGKKKMEVKAGVRIEMVKGKKNATDFALWKFTEKGVKRQMEWDSPWGKGFPGWHTECVVMGAKFLGVPFDIHCGGIDHIQIHHTNEIAQAEAAYDKILANYWMHGEFLNLTEGRMGKSAGNIITVETLIKEGINPLAYRYLCFNTHYRTKLTFSMEALSGAQNSLNNLYDRVINFSENKIKPKKPNKNYLDKFSEYIRDDLNAPKALGLMWQMLKDKNLPDEEKYATLLDFDKIFGFDLDKVKKPEIDKEIKKLAELREKCRKEKRWREADEIRKGVEKMGYLIEDTEQGPKIRKK
ncbi:MAG: cysteine--tRNA ligase [Parcubacteria group bacterium]|nr:MAG: cysteine--tRNA ligase [Parcubacteria group bacterium]